MYAQIEKSIDNTNKTFSKSITQKKSDIKQYPRSVNTGLKHQYLQLKRVKEPENFMRNMIDYNTIQRAWDDETHQDAIDHFAKHGSEFPTLTDVQQYHNAARKFTDGSDATTQTKTGKDGKTYYFNNTSGILAVVQTDGKISTMFRPKPSIHKKPTNQDFYDNK